jgi:hypothetical protein
VIDKRIAEWSALEMSQELREMTPSEQPIYLEAWKAGTTRDLSAREARLALAADRARKICACMACRPEKGAIKTCLAVEILRSMALDTEP